MKSYANNQPKVDPSVYIADTATVVGDVTIGANSSVWFSAVIRSDNNTITIGENTNIQDGAVVHEDPEHAVVIGNNVTVGHRAIIHGCTVEDDCLIGMGAILLSGCHIGKHSMVAAGALVTGKMDIPENSIVMGSPAKIIKPLPEDVAEDIPFAANEYVERGADYKNGLYKQAR